MRKIIKCQYIVFVFLSFMGCATNNYFIPIREIDKTVNVPEGSKSLSAYFEASINPDTIVNDFSGLLNPQMSYGITNNLCYPLFPLPALQYAVIGNNRTVNDTVYINSFNLSLIGGLAGLSYSTRDGISPILILGFYSKYRINNQYWCNIDLKFISDFSQSETEYSLLSNINLGLQFSNNFFSSISYIPHFEMYRYPQYPITNNYIEHEGRITIGFNPNYHFGLRLFAGYLYSPDRFDKHNIPIGSSLLFIW